MAALVHACRARWAERAACVISAAATALPEKERCTARYARSMALALVLCICVYGVTYFNKPRANVICIYTLFDHKVRGSSFLRESRVNVFAVLYH